MTHNQSKRFKYDRQIIGTSTNSKDASHLHQGAEESSKTTSPARKNFAWTKRQIELVKEIQWDDPKANPGQIRQSFLEKQEEERRSKLKKPFKVQPCIRRSKVDQMKRENDAAMDVHLPVVHTAGHRCIRGSAYRKPTSHNNPEDLLNLPMPRQDKGGHLDFGSEIQPRNPAVPSLKTTFLVEERWTSQLSHNAYPPNSRDTLPPYARHLAQHRLTTIASHLGAGQTDAEEEEPTDDRSDPVFEEMMDQLQQERVRRARESDTPASPPMSSVFLRQLQGVDETGLESEPEEEFFDPWQVTVESASEQDSWQATAESISEQTSWNLDPVPESVHSESLEEDA